MQGNQSGEKIKLKPVLAAAIILNAVYFIPLFGWGTGNIGIADSDYSFFMIEAIRKSVIQYRQFPMWDPWHMGGMPLMGNVQVPVSPFYFPVIFFGTVLGLKISLLILQVVGFLGVYFLGRHLGLDNFGGILAAVVWSLNGIHSVQLQSGYLLIWHLHLMPWIFLCFFKGFGDFRYTVPCALMLALLFLGGFPQPYPITLLPLGIMAVGVSISIKSFRPAVFVLLSFLLSLLITAVKAIPAIDWMSLNPRHLQEAGIVDGYSVFAFFNSLLNPNISLWYPTPKLFGTGHLEGMNFYWAPDYGMYIGPVVLCLALVGMSVRFPYRPVFLTTLTVLFLLALGDYSPIPLSKILRALPVYDSMRAIMRYRWPLMVIVSLLAAFGLNRLTKKDLFRWPALAFITATLLFANWPVINSAFEVETGKVFFDKGGSDEYFQVSRAKKYNKTGWVSRDVPSNEAVGLPMYPFIEANRGITLGYEPYDMKIFSRGRGAPDYKGEAFITTSEGFRKATIAEWSPNRVTVKWEKGIKGDLYLNQNYSKGWKVCGNSGKKLAESGLISVSLSEGDSEVTFCYKPVRVQIGAVVSAVSIIASLAYLFIAFRPSVKTEPA